MLKNIWKDLTGGTGVEYAVIAMVISIAAIGGYVSLGNEVTSNWETVNQEVTNANKANK
ncbi:MAG: Flp family type IVb pilin [Sphingomonadaceae bacterium]|nr:Flp family type IVb pilin [Sphingomonadaceae bacterium]